MPEKEPIEILKQKFSEYSQYLDDIRKRIFALIICFFIFFAVGFFAADRILALIIKITAVQGVTIATTSPFQLLNLMMSVGALVALIFCVPFAFYLLYDFLKDGLNKKEKRYFFILLPVSLLLFLVGFAYGSVILYFYLDIIANVNIHLGVKNFWDISSFLSQMIITSIFLGLVFQFPIVLTFLIRVGLVDAEYLRKKRYWAFAIIFIFVGFLPPPDIFSTIFEAAPLVLMYEATIVVNSFLNRKVLVNLT